MRIKHDGRTVRYADGGNAGDHSDPGVVMLHGSGMNRTVWHLQTRFLAHHGYRVAALDLPGHGGSDGPPLASIEQMADWVAEMVGVLDFGSAHVVGHSMGTYIALETAKRHPTAVRSLVLLGTASAMPVHPELLDSAKHNIPHAGGLMTSWGYSSRAHVGRHASPGFWLLGGSRALIEVSPDGALAADMAACQSYTAAVDAAACITCPVSVILGSDDKMTPVRSAQKLLAAFEPAAPAVDVPAVDVPAVDVPAVDVPAVDVPAVDVPAVDVPAVDVPAVDVPAVDVPAVDVPAVDVPAVDVPAVNVTVLDGVGHMIQFEDPDRVRTCIAEALRAADRSIAADDADR